MRKVCPLSIKCSDELEWTSMDILQPHPLVHVDKRGTNAPPLCVQMDFMRTFQTNAKCNNINHVWSHFCKILVVLKYHWRLWVNIFDRDISRCINTYIKLVYLAFFGIVMLLQMSVSKILAQGHLWYFKTTKKL